MSWKQIDEAREVAAVGPLLLLVHFDKKKWRAEVRIRGAIPDRILWNESFQDALTAKMAAVAAGREVAAEVIAALDELAY